MKPARLVNGFMTVGLWTLVSRVMGFARDMMIAAYLGTGPIAEAFLIAFSLPNMFRRFFAEGAFNMAFVPMFSKRLESGDDPSGFARDAFTGLATVLIGFTVVAMLFMPALVLLMASGFAGDERFELSVLFGRIAFPYILFISLAALLSGVLNSAGRFVAAAAAPVLLNLFFISALVIGDLLGWDTGLTLAWTVPIAGFGQFSLVWIAAKRAGFTIVPKRPRLTPDLKRLAIIAAPAALAGGVVQINLLVGRQVSSFFDGAVAWLSYADRLYQLPLGVVGIAVGVVLLPELSRRLRAGDTVGGRDAFNRATEFSLMLTVPAAAALVAIPVPLVETLFERGAFTHEDTLNTALAVAVYGLGLPAFVLQKSLQPLFFAREDTKRPFYAALFSMVVNAGLAIGLSAQIGFIAAAVGTTLSGWATVVVLWVWSRGYGDAATFDTRLKKRAWRILLSSIFMGMILWICSDILHMFFDMMGLKELALVLLIFLGFLSYFGIGQTIGAFQLSEIKGFVRRRQR